MKKEQQHATKGYLRFRIKGRQRVGIRWEVRIWFITKGRFKKIRENDIFCSTWVIDGVLV